MNRYELKDEVKEKYKPIIQNFLNKMRNLTVDEIENMDNKEFSISLSDTELNPYTLLTLMEDFGYGNEEIEDNGWQMDFLITIDNYDNTYDSTCEVMCIHGCGIIFELNLTVKEFL